MDKITVDIVVPLYNEEKILATSVAEIIHFLKESSFPYKYFITLAVNGSTDRTWEIADDLSNKYRQVRAIKIEGRGKGLAIRTAWQRSEAEILSFMDVDLASDLNYFRQLVDSIKINGNDMAIGNRLGKNSRVISRKNNRKLASSAFNMITRLILGSDLPDHQCGFKAMKKSSFDRILPGLQENGWIFDTEFIATTQRLGMRIASVEIIWRDGAASKVSMFRDSLKMFFDILRLRFRLGRNKTKAQ